MIYKKLLSIFLLSIIISGCASKPTGHDAFMTGLLLAEAEPISPKTQILIARYTHYLYQAELKDEERAELLFQRGITYDSIGLSSLARMDYAEAIKLNPVLAEAHNSVGVHYLLSGLYMLAYESFDATLELNPEHENALFNRGVALYYGGRSELAQQDTEAFLNQDTSDPIRAIWHYIITKNHDPETAFEQLSQARTSLNDDNWMSSIVDFYIGQANEREVIATLLQDVRSQTQLNNRLCEAYFYLGKYHSWQGNHSIAENYFKLSLSTNVYEYVEHRYARIELNKLREARRHREPLSS